MMPTFLVLGAAKAGTSSLYQYLSQHPQIYMSPQGESNFFAFEGQEVDFCGPQDMRQLQGLLTRTIEDYRAEFEGANGETAIGEVSPHNLYSPVAAANIRCHLPDAKMIVILRQPAERAFSAFTHLVRDGREETSDFREALRREPQRIRDNWEPLWHYANMGHYAKQLQRYFDRFRRQQIRVYLYDDYASDPLAVIKDIFDFVGVDRDFVPDVSQRYNVSLVPRSWRLHKLMSSEGLLKGAARTLLPPDLRWQIRTALLNRNLRRPRFDPDLRRELTDSYRSDIQELESLIGADLSMWLN